MLQEIYIHNFILIDELRLEFAPGINVLSGETGAGKSIIVDALGLALGDRINNSFIRDTSRKALVEAVFDVGLNEEARIFLAQQGLVEEDEGDIIILSREIHPNGRTAARINSRNVTAALLKNLSAYLVDIHLQSDRQNILQPARFLEYVDRYANDLADLPKDVAYLYRLLADKQRQLEELVINRQNRMQRIDFLGYQIKEIEGSKLQEGEEERLKAIRDRIKDAGKLLAASSRILELIYVAETGSSAYDQVAAAIDIVAANRRDSFFAELIEPLDNVYYTLQDLSNRISRFKEQLEFEPGELEDCEDRLYLIGKLKNKYGENVSAILNYLDQARRELKNLENSEEQQGELSAEIEEIMHHYMEKAGELSSKRHDSSTALQKKVHEELLELSMPDIRFEVAVVTSPVPTAHGLDSVEFLFSPNPGIGLKPVARNASGGEISRFILALKKVLAEVYSIPTLIFDEIDVGLGGTALNAVARKLAGLAPSHQLILVTHAPQVACLGGRNMVIEKHVAEGQTFTRVRILDEEDKVRELARMLDGDNYSELTLQHARAMISQAQNSLRT